MPSPVPLLRPTTALLPALGAVVLAALLASCTSGSQSVATTTTGPTTTTVPETTTTTEPPLEAGRQLFVYNPEPGHCFDVRNVPDGTSVARSTNPTRRNDDQVILLLDCAVPHHYEVGGLVEITGLEGPHPGIEDLAGEAQRLCPPAFDAYVGIGYERSELEMGWLLPRVEEWNQGQRTVACLIIDPDGGRLTGTVRGSGR